MNQPTDKYGEVREAMLGMLAFIQRLPQLHMTPGHEAYDRLLAAVEKVASPSAVLEPVLCDSATAVCSICQEPVERHRDIEAVRSSARSQQTPRCIAENAKPAEDQDWCSLAYQLEASQSATSAQLDGQGFPIIEPATWNAAIERCATLADEEWVGQNSLGGSKLARRIADRIRDLKILSKNEVVARSEGAAK